MTDSPAFDLTSLRGIRGANYLPSYAANAPEMWCKFDPDQTAFELDLARSIGLNAVRFWLSSEAYFDDPAGFLSTFDHFLELCERAGLRAWPIVFDSCGVETRSAAAETIPAEDLFEQFKRGDHYPPDVRKKWTERLETYIKEYAPRVRCTVSPSAAGLLWEQWRPNPGYSQLGESTRERYVPYADALVDAHRKDERIIAWDILNEPWIMEGLSPNFDDPLPAEFARFFCAHVRERDCGIPITVGCSSLELSLRFADCVDIISFHCYDQGEELTKELDGATEAIRSHQKPVVLTECLALMFFLAGLEAMTDAAQLAVYEQELPLIEQSGIGWFQTGLMIGRAAFSYVGLCYPNGLRRPAARHLAEYLAGERGDMRRES